MSTKPTKLQLQARDRLAEALNLIADAARLDGRSQITPATWAVVAVHVARASSAFTLDEIVAKALERRALGIGLSPGMAELITLVESKTRPLDMLLLDDEEFRAIAAAADEELGGL